MADGFLLFFTGETRKATDILQDQDKRTRELDAGDGRQPRPHQGDRPREPRAAGVGRPDGLRRADARALAQQARAARPGMSTGRVNELYELARGQRRRRRQAGGRGRRRLPARLLARAGPAARGDVRRRAPTRCASASTSTGSSGRSTREPAGRHRRLRPHGRASAPRRSARRRASWPSATPTRPGRPSWPSPPAPRRRPTSTACSPHAPDVVIVATTHDALADAACRALAGGRPRAGREARRPHRRRGRPHRRRRRGRRAAGEGGLQPPLPPGHRPRDHRGARGRARRARCTCAPATATAAAPATTASGAPTRRSRAAASCSTRACTCSTSATGCSAPCRCTRRCCARASGTCRSRTTRVVTLGEPGRARPLVRAST